MTQYSMPALLLSNGIMDATQKSTAKTRVRDDNSFMNILNERIEAKSSLKPHRSPLGKAGNIPDKEDHPVRDRKDPVPKATGTEELRSGKTKEASQGVDNEDTKAVSRPDSRKEKEDTLMTLESMLALLEELLAKLDIKTVAAGPIAAKAAELLQADTQSISPVELLKAMLEGNAEKLKALAASMEKAGQSPEVKELLDKLSEFIQKLSDQHGSKVLNELVIETETSEIPVGELINQLREQCRELIEKLRGRISELKNQLDGESDMAMDEVQPESIQAAVAETQNQTDEQTAAGKNDEGEAKQHTKGINEKPLHHTVHTQPQNEAFAERIQASDSMVSQSGQKPSEDVRPTVEKPVFTLPEKPLAQTVTNQVVMKVKLMAGENRQEMEMHLKPESLGRLSLKIIHERGEILARITAENEQVKGILESNMHLLKDALEKNGLSVQNLSVSVGSGNEDRQPEQGGQENGKAGSQRLVRPGKVSSAGETLNLRERAGREYLHQDSRIDLIA